MPKITKCNAGHFYDAERFSGCPYCSKSEQPNVDPVGPTGGVTVPVNPPAGAGGGVTVPVNPPTGAGGGVTVPVNPPTGAGSGVTVPWEDVQNKKTVHVSGSEADEQKTVAKYTLGTETGKEPVVGWLVAVDGKHRGEDFRLKAGKNFIGRDKSMDVVLANDKSVSRVKHAIFTYDPKGNMFIVHSGETHELTYFNGEVLLDSRVVKAYDKLSVGETTLMFIPLVGDNFSWE